VSFGNGGAAAAAPEAAGALRRFGLVLNLRRKLLFRGPGRGVGAKILFGVVLLQVLIFAAFAGYGVYRLAVHEPRLADNVVRLVFLVVFVLQVTLGVLGVAVSEFFDTSRLLHLPVGPRELFAAMSVSALFSPTNLFAAAPIVGVLAARSGGFWDVAPRLFVFLLALWFAHIIALAVGFAFLRLFSRRRLRDLATIGGSILGVAMYLGFRALTDQAGTNDLAEGLSNPLWARLGWLPSQWFAEIFVAVGAGQAPGWWYVAAAAAALPLALHVGALAFRSTYDAAGETGHAGESVAEVRAGFARFLPFDVAAIVKVTYAIFRREPQLRALLIQQFVFLAAPVVMQTGRGGTRGSGPKDFSEGFIAIFVPIMIVLSHAAVSLSFFGVDGRGLGSLFAAPIRRSRLLMARVVALTGVFGAIDLFAAVLVTLVLRALRGDFTGAIGDATQLFALSLIGDVVQLACGAVLSVVAPMAVVRTRRGAAPRLGKEGCLTLLVRMFVLVPVGFLGAIVVVAAAAPRWLNVGPEWYVASVAVAALLLVLLVKGGVAWGAHLLETREPKVLAALTDTGE
jgi:hypothetical protein